MGTLAPMRNSLSAYGGTKSTRHVLFNVQYKARVAWLRVLGMWWFRYSLYTNAMRCPFNLQWATTWCPIRAGHRWRRGAVWINCAESAKITDWITRQVSSEHVVVVLVSVRWKKKTDRRQCVEKGRVQGLERHQQKGLNYRTQHLTKTSLRKTLFKYGTVFHPENWFRRTLGGKIV